MNQHDKTSAGSAGEAGRLYEIANAVVPRQELLDAQVDLALAHLLRDDPPATGRLDAGSSPEAGLRDAEDHQAR